MPYKLFNSICARVEQHGAAGTVLVPTLNQNPPTLGAAFTIDWKRTPKNDWKNAVVDDEAGIDLPHRLSDSSPIGTVSALYVEIATFQQLVLAYPWPNGTGYSFAPHQFQSLVYQTSLARYHGFHAWRTSGATDPHAYTVRTFTDQLPYGQTIDVDVLLDPKDPKQCAADLFTASSSGGGSVFIDYGYCASARTPGGGTTVLRGPKQPPYG